MSESNNLNKNQLQNAYQRAVSNIYDLYLTGPIGDAKDYQDWNQMMRSAMLIILYKYLLTQILNL